MPTTGLQRHALAVVGRAALHTLRPGGPAPGRILETAFARLELGGDPDGTRCTAKELAESLRTLRTADAGTRRLALRLLVELAVESGSVSLGLRDLGDLTTRALGLEDSALAREFLARTGDPLPDAWDPGDPQQWRRQAAGPAQKWAESAAPRPPGPPPGRGTRAGAARIDRIRALALLGLDEDAGAEEIRRAFLRISKVHHPDAFAREGEEAVREAAATFRRIREAYEFLQRDGTA